MEILTFVSSMLLIEVPYKLSIKKCLLNFIMPGKQTVYRQTNKQKMSITTKCMTDPRGCSGIIKCLLKQPQPKNKLLVMFFQGLIFCTRLALNLCAAAVIDLH